MVRSNRFKHGQVHFLCISDDDRAASGGGAGALLVARSLGEDDCAAFEFSVSGRRDSDSSEAVAALRDAAQGAGARAGGKVFDLPCVVVGRARALSRSLPRLCAALTLGEFSWLRLVVLGDPPVARGR